MLQSMSADSSFPYTPTPGKLEEFLKKLQTIGVPTKIDQKYLGAVGFGSSNGRPFIPIMKKINLLDGSGKPTDHYTKGLRGGEAGKRLVAAGIRDGYAALFAIFDDAPSRSSSELATFVKSHSTHDDRKVALAVSTFQALCRFGDFSGATTAGNVSQVDEQDAAEVEPVVARAKGGRSAESAGNVTINVNIALSVDATSDPAVYDAFFAAMAKHIKVLDGST